MEHPNQTKLFCQIAGALLGLLVLTVAVSFINLGVFSTPVALLIATIKALLVALFFMELRESDKTIWLIAAAGLLWLMILMGGTIADVLSRAADVVPIR